MIDLYEPSLTEKSLQITLQSYGPLSIEADAALIHRMIDNLFDNELKHLPSGCLINLQLKAEADAASLSLEDNGPGIDPEVSFISSSAGSRDEGRTATVWACLH